MKAGDAKLPGAGMSPKQRARKCVAEKVDGRSKAGGVVHVGQDVR